MLSKKKEVERRYLESFAASRADVPVGSIEDSESPDFIVRSDAGAIGIELTELFLPSQNRPLPLQAMESLQERVLKNAQGRYAAAGKPHVRVAVFFNDHIDISKSDVGSVAMFLHERVSTNVPQMNDTIDLEDDGSADDWPDVINGITISRYPFFTSTEWVPPRAGFEFSANKAFIQVALDAKAPAIERYRQNCSRVWVLLVIGGYAPSSFVDISDEAAASGYTSRFDRAFAFWGFGRRTKELRLLQPKPEVPSR